MYKKDKDRRGSNDRDYYEGARGRQSGIGTDKAQERRVHKRSNINRNRKRTRTSDLETGSNRN